MRSLADQHLGRCIHYGGVRDRGKCKKGIDLQELAQVEEKGEFGWIKRLPCLAIFDTEIVCEHRQFPTQEEAEEYEKRVTLEFERFTQDAGPVIRRIKEEHAGKSWIGTVECPRCGGELKVSHAAINGHVHGCCKTPGCLSWME